MAAALIALVVLVLLAGAAVLVVVLTKPGAAPGPAPGTNFDPLHQSGLALGVVGKHFKSSTGTAKPASCRALLQTNLFYWDWSSDPGLAASDLSPDEQKLLAARFVPMLWGVSSPPDGAPASLLAPLYTDLMLYNEPDHFGPPPHGFGCGQDTLSSGTFALEFSILPELVTDSKKLIDNFKKDTPKNRIWAPALANARGTAGKAAWDCDGTKQVDSGGCSLTGAACAPATTWTACSPANSACMCECAGWLSQWQTKIGDSWAQVDVLVFHCYASKAEDVIKNFTTITEKWPTKDIAITEMAMMNADLNTPAGVEAVKDFMTTVVTQCRALPRIKFLAWFSIDTWAGWDTWNPVQYSALFNTYGEPTEIGKHWIELAAPSGV